MSQEPDRIHRVEQACLDLVTSDQPVTFDQVAACTGLSRATLYRNPELPAVIKGHRHREAHSRRARHRQLHITVEDLAAKVRRHEEPLRCRRHRGIG